METDRIPFPLRGAPVVVVGFTTLFSGILQAPSEYKKRSGNIQHRLRLSAPLAFLFQWSWRFVVEFEIVAYGASESWFTLVHVMLDKPNYCGFLFPQPDKSACENLEVWDRRPKHIIFDEPEYISGEWNAMRM